LRADQQTQFLKERMQEYKMAAINAKKNNDIALAKQYLRMAKVCYYNSIIFLSYFSQK
jgi:coiled-coil and C2 domain-containing protein 1